MEIVFKRRVHRGRHLCAKASQRPCVSGDGCRTWRRSLVQELARIFATRVCCGSYCLVCKGRTDKSHFRPELED